VNYLGYVQVRKNLDTQNANSEVASTPSHNMWLLSKQNDISNYTVILTQLAYVINQ